VRRVLLPIVAIVTVTSILLVAGCGDSGEKNDYVDEVNSLQTDLVQRVSTAAGEAPTNQKQAADYAGKIAAIFGNAADQFAAVDPPDDVADLHSQLVGQIRSIAADTRKTERTLREGTPEQARRALNQLRTAATDAQNRLNMLIDEINADLHD
jgi:rRNA processing protein Gar1